MQELSDIMVLRKRYGMTQKELAQSAGVSQSLIAKIESGLIDPSYTKTKQIFEALESYASKTGLKARDFMNSQVITMNAEDSIMKSAQKMKKHGISQLPVLSSGRLAGTVSESLILDAIMEHKSQDTPVSEIMENAPPTLDIDARMSVVTGVLKFYPLVLITRKDRIMGVITKADLVARAYR